jgi:hypothetical protein
VAGVRADNPHDPGAPHEKPVKKAEKKKKKKTSKKKWAWG